LRRIDVALRRRVFRLLAPFRYQTIDLCGDSDGRVLSEITRENRAALGAVPCWIRESDYESSIFNYGLPRRVRHLIDADIGPETTYSDILLYLAGSLRREVRYLEIGVSVGKNFYQVLQRVRDAQLTGFDIEDINPVLESVLHKTSRVEWETLPTSIRKKPSSLTAYEFAQNRNSVRYVAGDLFDDASWMKLRGGRFNLIFSDAFHSSEALMQEWRMIKSLELLDSAEFVVLWDDLGNRHMRAAFHEIVGDMRDVFGIRTIEAGIELYRGWLGRHEMHHPVGFARKSPS
jgi:hypothetical protein